MMLLTVALLFFVGLFLSALFSGSETGFYRVNRARLVLDSRSGDHIARFLLHLSNRPTLFVATVLVGNNIANNVTSLAVVLGARYLPGGDQAVFESILPIAVSPIVFVYGELMPKYLFYQAPNRLLRLGGPLFLLSTLILAPVTAVLWAFGQLLQSLVGQTPLRVALRVARSELAQMLREGQEAGILEPTQRVFTQAIVETGPEPVEKLSTPIARIPCLPLGCLRSDVYRLARRQRTPRIAIRESGGETLIGYVRMIDLKMTRGERVDQVESFLRLRHDLPVAEALVELRRTHKEWALLIDPDEKPLGLVSLDQLLQPLLRES